MMRRKTMKQTTQNEFELIELNNSIEMCDEYEEQFETDDLSKYFESPEHLKEFQKKP